jgi:hypothetical protein
MLESFGLAATQFQNIPQTLNPRLARKHLLGFVIPGAIFAVVASLGYGVFLAPFTGDMQVMGVHLNGWVEPLRAALPVTIPSMNFLETLTLSQVVHAAFWWYTHVEN